MDCAVLLQPCMLHLCSVSMLFAQCGIALVAFAEAGVQGNAKLF